MPPWPVLHQRRLPPTEMTGSLLLIARLVLCGVFTVAAWGKLTDREGTRAAVVGFGAPERAVGALALGIPIVELIAAALLLPARTAEAGAIVGIGLLIVFSLAIAVNVAHGRAPECHCFGQLHSAPAGPKTLARNGVLMAAALLVLVGGGGPSAVAWIGRLHDSALVAVVAGVAIGALAVGGALAFVTLLRSYGRALVRLERLERAVREAGIEVEGEAAPGLDVIRPQRGLQPGTPAPRFTATEVAGASVSLDDLLTLRHPVMLVFASPNCGPCAAMMPEVAAWQREHADRLTVAVASDGSLAEVRSKAEQFDLLHVLHDEDNELYGAFQANGTPGAVLIGGDGAIASYVASGRDAIEDLMHEVLDAPGLPVGAPVPALELVGFDGDPVALARGSDVDTLVLFWNPDCGYCRAMHEDLLAWEAGANGQSPRLVVVSSGDPERTREDGFTSTVLLDPEFSAGDAFGAGGTPSALLLGADGRVASGVAVGAQGVLGLAHRSAVPSGAGVR